MTSLFIIRFIKTLMVTTPFLAMTLMVLALWGVGGKTTYSDMPAAKQEKEFTAVEAKNYLVNEIKSHELHSTETVEPKICGEDNSSTTTKEPSQEKIDWDLVV